MDGKERKKKKKMAYGKTVFVGQIHQRKLKTRFNAQIVKYTNDE